MWEISFKSMIFAGFCVLAVNLCSCLPEPVSIGNFLKDEIVLEIIERKQERVIITDDSEGIAGNKRIYGLETNRYYLIDELFNAAGNPVENGLRYITANGIRSTDPLNIRRFSGREITGLINFHTYKVKSAQAVIEELTYYDVNIPPPPPLPQVLRNFQPVVYYL
jgi:hypothetical protein